MLLIYRMMDNPYLYINLCDLEQSSPDHFIIVKNDHICMFCIYVHTYSVYRIYMARHLRGKTFTVRIENKCSHGKLSW